MQGKPPHIALNLFPPDFITFLRHQIAQKSDEVRRFYLSVYKSIYQDRTTKYPRSYASKIINMKATWV